MDSTTRARLASTFEAAASSYAAGRPSYPPEVIAWMVGAAPRTVLDLAAGTGALTKLALHAGHSVTAADLSAAMLGELGEVSRSNRACRPVQCSAEALPFARASFDAVTVATAFHWFDPGRALPEIARVLRTNGTLALTWNTRDETAKAARRLGELLRSAQPPSRDGAWATDSVQHVKRCGLFGPLEYAEFHFEQTLDSAGLVDLVASRSYVMALDDNARAPLLDTVRELFDEAATLVVPGTEQETSPPAGNSMSATNAEPARRLRLGYRAQCWRTNRAGGGYREH